jgi:hypothetical protein
MESATKNQEPGLCALFSHRRALFDRCCRRIALAFSIPTVEAESSVSPAMYRLLDCEIKNLLV